MNGIESNFLDKAYQIYFSLLKEDIFAIEYQLTTIFDDGQSIIIFSQKYANKVDLSLSIILESCT
jgi:hypothetical protein